MRKRSLALTLAVAACSASPRATRPPTAAPALELRGALKGGPFSLDRADLRALPRRTVRGVDPRTGKAATFAGPSVAALVSGRYEPKRGADTAVARTGDGEAIPVPLTVIRQLKPVLADEVDGVALAAPLLAWPSLEAPGLESDPRAAGWWASGVVALEIIEWQRTFAPALALAEGAPDGARRGAAVFAERCIRCHSVRAVGGRKGPDLTQVASRLGEERFSGLVQRHPGRPPPDGERDAGEVTAEVWAFLRAIEAGGALQRPEDLPGGRPDGAGPGRGPRRPGQR